ncbi:Os06g0331150 [Oryza sativa Japonica Group]|uniref:Os06g0331150 protein n=1 Tax=Oryza sativa subsp. japonica TaxID=39947 RepID=A0A0P0WWI8_ORYSJ|nr:Os06g0331150 [Oryza sativa Japonica Group]
MTRKTFQNLTSPCTRRIRFHPLNSNLLRVRFHRLSLPPSRLFFFCNTFHFINSLRAAAAAITAPPRRILQFREEAAPPRAGERWFIRAGGRARGGRRSGSAASRTSPAARHLHQEAGRAVQEGLGALHPHRCGRRRPRLLRGQPPVHPHRPVVIPRRRRRPPQPLLRARPRVHDCEPEALRRAADEAKVEVARLRDVAGRRFWWWWEATNVEALGEAELPEFARALGRVRAAVVRRHAL